MLPNNGFNPLRWNCEKQGCFNLEKRPKIEVFADCLPGKIAFTDVDGIVEVNSNFLFLEWKDHQELGTGQRVLFERLTDCCPATVFVVEGNAKTMEIESVAVVWSGKVRPREIANLDGLRERIRKWVAWAHWNPVGKLVGSIDIPVDPPF